MIGALLGGALLLQRSRPVLGLVALCTVVVGHVVLLEPSVTFGHFVAVFVASYVAARGSTLRPALACLALVGLTTAVIGIRAADPDFEYVFPVFVFGGGWVLGRVVRAQARQAGEMAELNRRLESHQEEIRRMAALEERGRIAGDLHDVLAHSMTSIVVQAGAADEMLDRDPAHTRALLHRIEHAGRSGLTELRHLLRALDDERPGPASPLPRLDDVPGLVDTARAAGASVEIELHPGDAPLPDGLQVTVYRLVQEALTNVVRHAGPVGVRVRLERSGGDLVVEVISGPSGSAPQARTDDGRGLRGMAARVAMYGGEFRAGATADGGFEVRARLPVVVVP